MTFDPIISPRWAGAVGLFVAASGLSGQATGTPRCDSIVAAARTDSVSVAIFIRSLRISGDLELEQSRLISQTVASAFIAPRPFRMSVFSGPSQMVAMRRLHGDSAGGLRAPTVTGVYRFTTTKDSLKGRVETLRTSLVPGFDSAAVDAIIVAASIKEARTPPDGDDADSMRIEVRFSTDSLTGAFRLVSADFPRMPVIDAVPSRDNPPPAFPSSAKDDSITAGEVVLRFVVDQSGGVIARTIEVVRASRVDFLRAALETLPSQRFSPATIRGCPVAQVVDYSFSFVLPPETKPPDAVPRRD